MAIGHLYTQQHGFTILQLGPATAENYRRSGRMAKALLARTQDKGERRTIGEMVGECEYAAEWLETGRRPGNRRGIERRAAYQRERPVDPLVMQAYIGNRSAGGAVQASSVSDDDRQRIDNMFAKLTEKEREAYLMVRGDGLSYEEVAEILQIKRGSVQSRVESAQGKIQKMLFTGDIFDFL
ncbi:sigma-70 family RNA polymerase sigma factor [Cohnella sp. GCM10020058]|uniref:sigma-70 family RNA polymerase sigma factor n=1 Tax=Cohnella sp. GCM10020058 TaxID=3317330 RepID=UPI003634E588